MDAAEIAAVPVSVAVGAVVVCFLKNPPIKSKNPFLVEVGADVVAEPEVKVAASLHPSTSSSDEEEPLRLFHRSRRNPLSSSSWSCR